MYTLRSIVRRGSALGGALAILVATVVPSTSVFADALNPLTDRSLTLSSSAPGYVSTDGSGNTTYSPPNSGANGQKSGNTFAFKVSSTANVKGISFQYCTKSAGNCLAPGNNTYSGSSPNMVRGNDSVGDRQSDLNIVTVTPSQPTLGSYVDVNSTDGDVTAVPAANSTGNNFLVYYLDTSDNTWKQSTGWTMDSDNKEESGTEGAGTATGKNNYITLTKAAGEDFDAGQRVKIVFFATNANYITNPGEGEFFVKINTYNSDTSLIPGNVIDGGVTVANVMNHSIEIQTKVLETMDFSVGTVDPYTLSAAQLQASSLNKSVHGVCDPILTGMTPSSAINILKMGNELGEDSLETDRTYSTHSYWRLSSNSSAGATVYYSGVTLSNTVGDQIDPIHSGDGVKAAPAPGSEQFGLALANGDGSDISGDVGYQVDYGVERGASAGLTGEFENGNDTATNGIHASVATDVGSNLSYHDPQLYPLVPATNYDDGAGVVNNNYNNQGAINTNFAFKTASNLIPEPIASQNTKVVDCVTGKMRYIANIAATTPAGIYTTKINYIAAPQY